MIYLLAIFCPPLYFLVQKKWVSFVFHSILYLVALALFFSIIGIVVAFPLYLISAVCAVWDLRKRMVEEQATLIANKMAEAMRNPPPNP